MTPIGKDITKCNEIACSSMSYTLFVFHALMFVISLLCLSQNTDNSISYHNKA